MKKIMFVFAILVTLFGFVGCGGNPGDPLDPILDVEITSGNQSFSLPTLTNTLQLITNTDGDGSVTRTWASSNAAVATVDVNGMLTAEGVGTATITVTASADGWRNGQDTIQVTVDMPLAGTTWRINPNDNLSAALTFTESSWAITTGGGGTYVIGSDGITVRMNDPGEFEDFSDNAITYSGNGDTYIFDSTP